MKFHTHSARLISALRGRVSELLGSIAAERLRTIHARAHAERLLAETAALRQSLANVAAALDSGHPARIAAARADLDIVVGVPRASIGPTERIIRAMEAHYGASVH